jgi:hypothetical protein
MHSRGFRSKIARCAGANPEGSGSSVRRISGLRKIVDRDAGLTSVGNSPILHCKFCAGAQGSVALSAGLIPGGIRVYGTPQVQRAVLVGRKGNRKQN